MWLRNAVSDQLGHMKLVSVGEQRFQRESRGIPNVTTHVASFVPIRRVCPHHWLEIGGMLKVRWPGLLLRVCGRSSPGLIGSNGKSLLIAGEAAAPTMIQALWIVRGDHISRSA